jgi:uncharacterized membrane protein/nitrite reductase/ring-hydroxylating ferredoxin subunit
MSLRKLLEGRPLGHPLHSLLVHLPMGLWLFALILDIVAFSSANEWALTGAAWSLLAGTSIAILAAITGFNDWLDMRAEHPAQNLALWHMGLNLAATVLFALDTLLHFTHRETDTGAAIHINGFMIGLSIVAYGLTIASGYLGGLLIYNHGIAVGRHRRSTELPHHTIHEPRKGTTETPLAPSAGLPREFHPVIPEAALAEGSTLRAEICGTLFVLVRAGRDIYAVQEFCTHRCGPLSEGAVEDGQIRCPWHNSCFDIATGKVTRGPAKVDLKTYEVRIGAGIVHVCIDHPAPPPPPSNAPEPAGAGADQRIAERRNPAEPPIVERDLPRDHPARRTPAE